MSGIGRLRARIANSGGDEGSAVIVLPILGLLVCAGAAALIGISLQPSEPTTPPPSINSSKLDGQCLGNDATSAQQAIAALGSCIEGRIAEAYGSRDAALVAGFAGVAATQRFDGTPVVVVRWTGTAPTAVNGWVARFPNGSVSVATTSASS